SFSSGSKNQLWIAWTSCGAGGGLDAPPRSCTHICSTGFQVKTGASCRPTTSITARLTGMLTRLTRSWVSVGTQSVGGGTSTLLLIRRLAVDRERRSPHPRVRPARPCAPRDRCRSLHRRSRRHSGPRNAHPRRDRSRGCRRRARPRPRATDLARELRRLNMDALALLGVFLKA